MRVYVRERVCFARVLGACVRVWGVRACLSGLGQAYVDAAISDIVNQTYQWPGAAVSPLSQTLLDMT